MESIKEELGCYSDSELSCTCEIGSDFSDSDLEDDDVEDDLIRTLENQYNSLMEQQETRNQLLSELELENQHLRLWISKLAALISNTQYQTQSNHTECNTEQAEEDDNASIISETDFICTSPDHQAETKEPQERDTPLSRKRTRDILESATSEQHLHPSKKSVGLSCVETNQYQTPEV